LVPSSPEAIKQALSTLKIARLLQGYRGQVTADPRRVIDGVLAIQAYVVANAKSVIEVEVNPLLITLDEAIAVDALIVRTT
ncbi:MAG: acetate--CoA ligase family protein, partial [Pseudomonadota bacterium]